MSKPKAVITPECLNHLPGRHVELLEKSGFEVCYTEDPDYTRGLFSVEDSIKVMEPYSAVIAGSEPYPDEVLSNLPNLRVLARFGVGYDPVDVPSATRNNKAVPITPASTHEAVAELCLGLIFCVAKSLIANNNSTRVGAWSREVLLPVREQTLGLVGLGRIGRSTATRAKALGMRVIACDDYPPEEFAKEHGIEIVSFDDLLANSDYVSLHCPMNAETAHLMNTETFAKMKPGSVFVNTARGGLVNEQDLIEALNSGHLSAAALDVFEQEPPPPSNPLFKLENVIVAPHLAGLDRLSVANMAHEAAECIVKLHQNTWPTGKVVNTELEDSWAW